MLFRSRNDAENSRSAYVNDPEIQACFRCNHGQNRGDKHEGGQANWKFVAHSDGDADRCDMNQTTDCKQDRNQGGCEFHGLHVQDLVGSEEEVVPPLLELVKD